jgi:hypothetical protein
LEIRKGSEVCILKNKDRPNLKISIVLSHDTSELDNVLVQLERTMCNDLKLIDDEFKELPRFFFLASPASCQ